MASLSHDKNGGRRVQFIGPDGSRPALYLGKVPPKKAEAFRDHVSTLCACYGHPDALPEETLRWALDLPDAQYDVLAKACLMPPRMAKQNAPTIEKLVRDFEAEMVRVKASTQATYRQTTGLLLERFADRTVASITNKDADECATWVRSRVSPATAARRIKAMRTIFKRALRWEWISANPFAEVKAGMSVNPARQAFVPLADFEKLVAATSDLEFRCVLALCRIGALRSPSEILLLRWVDVRWEERQMIVRSPKTEHHAGGAARIVPIFPRLGQILQAWFAEAPEGAEFVVDSTRSARKNWRTRLQRLIARAGVKPWPRLFQNLRASRESELVADYNIMTVSRWLGHTPDVAQQHYLMDPDKDASFRQAAGLPADHRTAQKAAQQGVEKDGIRGNGRGAEGGYPAANGQEAAFSGEGHRPRRDSNPHASV